MARAGRGGAGERQHLRRLRGHRADAGDVQEEGAPAMHEAAAIARLGADRLSDRRRLLHPRAARPVEPDSSRRGNRLGMVGMAIAVVTTLYTHALASLAEIADRHRDRRRDRPGHRAADPDDRDAAAGRRLSQPGRHGRGAGRRGGLPQSRSLRHPRCVRPDPSGQPGRDGPRRRDRRDHLLGLGDRLPQAQRQHVGQADPAAGAARHQSRHAGRDPRPDRLFHPGPGAVDLLDRRPRSPSRSASC